LNAWSALASGAATEDLEIELLLEALFQRFGIDFRGYARPALRRRVQDLMQAQSLGTISALQERVQHQQGAVSSLLRALAVAPAPLFGQPERARQLRGVLPAMLGSTPLPRLWLAECAGIGEAWTLAILLAEAQLLSRAEIFATLANEDLLAEVREATLPAAAMPQFQKAYEQSGGTGQLTDYFEVSGGRAVLLPHVRGRINWAHYSLVTDASFNEFQAILCCHALPDFGPLLRQRVLRLFHDSLARFGLLGLDGELAPSDSIAGKYHQLAAGQPWYKRIS
jgi:chemotaxis protein methyltransferase CheR